MESVIKNPDSPGSLESFATIRPDSYVLLASLLNKPPSGDLLNVLQNLDWGETIPEKVNQALKALCQAGYDYTPAILEEEFNRLFIGLGRGEIVPYASWYQEERPRSAPLALLRSDLMALGIVRQAECHEPEDHAGALCETMALISQAKSNVPYEAQAGFFRHHLASWMATFFEDLQSARSAEFYRRVGLFGRCFFESEREYLGLTLS